MKGKRTTTYGTGVKPCTRYQVPGARYGTYYGYYVVIFCGTKNIPVPVRKNTAHLEYIPVYQVCMKIIGRTIACHYDIQ